MKLHIAHRQFMEKLTDEGKSPSTLTAYKKDIEQLIEHLSELEVEVVQDINIDHLKGFMKALEEKGYTAKSISRKTNATRTFMTFLHDLNHITDNIGLKLKHPKVEAKNPRILSRLEYRALRDAARDDIRSYAMIEVLLQTGITISELSAMELSHIEEHEKKSAGTLFIPKRNRKAARTVPLNRAVIEAIQNYKDNHRPSHEDAVHVFITKTGRPILVRNIRSTINRFFNLAGVENATVNDIRHTFMAHHLQNGAHPEFLSQVAGHKRVSTTEKYIEFIDIEEPGNKRELVIL